MHLVPLFFFRACTTTAWSKDIVQRFWGLVNFTFFFLLVVDLFVVNLFILLTFEYIKGQILDDGRKTRMYGSTRVYVLMQGFLCNLIPTLIEPESICR